MILMKNNMKVFQRTSKSSFKKAIQNNSAFLNMSANGSGRNLFLHKPSLNYSEYSETVKYI